MKILITGSGKKGRTGNGLALHLASKGHIPILHCHTSRHDAKETEICLQRSFGVDAFAVCGDLTSQVDVLVMREEIQARAGHVDALVHCGGNYFTDVMSTNVNSAHLACTHLGSLIPAHAGGRIILFGAVGIQHGESPWSQEYTDAKRELLRYMRHLAIQLAPEETTVNMISPGIMSYSITHQEVTLPTSRFVFIEDVAPLCEFLLGPGAAQITGQNIEVAGGYALSQ